LAAERAGRPIEPRLVPYVEGQQVQVRTERYGQQTVMSPGEIDHLVSDLIRDLSARPDNDPAQAAEYRRVLFGFCKDWRALWYQYGIHEAGWLQYDALLKATLAALPDGDPPVLGGDNGVAAKRIFIERVGYTAVQPRLHPQFLRGLSAAPATDPGLGRNAPCPCGSGRRYKHCHGVS
jgi:hypothetical protein